MPKKKNKESRTEKQKKLVKLITDNLGNTGLTKSMYELMIEAGYSHNSARQQSNIKATITDDVEPIVQAMIKERDAAIEMMSKLRSKAKYRDMTDAIDKLTKNIQLLSGKETDRVEHVRVYVPERK